MFSAIQLSEAMRMYKRAIYVKRNGFRKYKGDAEKICSQIIEDCWNEKDKYFMTSTGHFCQYYNRDFSWCAEPLIKLGWKSEVKQTLEYAFAKFKKKEEVTVAITPKGAPFNFPNKTPESVANLMRSLYVCRGKDLIKENWDFLQDQIGQIAHRYINKETGLIKRSIHLSSIRDHAIRYASCYDNIMLASLSDSIEGLGMNNPLRRYDYKKTIKKHFYSEGYFHDRINPWAITGDSNVFPYWTGIYNDHRMIKGSVLAIQKEGLDQPFPLRYEKGIKKTKTIKILEWVAGNYEGNTIWTHIGPLYINVLQRIDRKKAKEHIRQYAELIEKHKTFLEIYNPDGTPYQTPFYVSDEGMLWASMILAMMKGG